MNKNTNKLILLALVLLIAPMSAMAATFSDNFNDCDVLDWTVTLGSFSAINTAPSVDGTCYAFLNQQGAGDIVATKTTNTGNNVAFDIIPGGALNTGRSVTVYFQCTANCVTYNGMQFTQGAIYLVSTGANTYVQTTYTVGYAYHIVIAMSGATTSIVISNYSTGVVYNTQTFALAPLTSPGFFRLAQATPSGAGMTAKIDNIVSQDLPFGATITNIAWQNSQYTVGDSPAFNWTITDADWNGHPLQIYVARLYKSGIMQDWGTWNWVCLCSTQLGLSQSGSYVVSADTSGTYVVTMELSSLLGTTLVDDSTTSVHMQSSSYFTIPTTANQNTNVSAVFHLGTGGMHGVLQTFWIDANGIEQFEKSFYTTGLDGPQIITFSQVGRYNVKLYNYNDGTLLQTKSITIIFFASTPVGNFALSTIKLNSATYNRYDIMTGNFTIDAVNYTRGTVFISLYNNDIGAQTGVFYGKSGQSAGSVEGALTPPDYGQFNYYIVNTVDDRPNIVWIAGNNTMRLMLQNGSTSALTLLATANFTLVDLDATGYGITVTPTSVNINQNVRITTICPTDCILSVQRPNGATSYFNISSGTRTLFQAYPSAGKYSLALMDSGSHIHMTVIVTVSSTVSPGVTIPPGGSGAVTISTALSLMNVFGVIAFWGFVIWLGIVGSIIVTMSNSASGINGTAVIAVAWFAAIFIAIIGLFDPFKIYIIVISTIIAAVYFKFGRTTTMED
jgi:hypothetical protein